MINSKGEVIVTDSEAGSIYRLVHGELRSIGLEGPLYPNGIALSEDEQTIDVAHALE